MKSDGLMAFGRVTAGRSYSRDVRIRRDAVGLREVRPLSFSSSANPGGSDSMFLKCSVVTQFPFVLDDRRLIHSHSMAGFVAATFVLHESGGHSWVVASGRSAQGPEVSRRSDNAQSQPNLWVERRSPSTHDGLPFLAAAFGWINKLFCRLKNFLLAAQFVDAIVKRA